LKADWMRVWGFKNGVSKKSRIKKAKKENLKAL
jgi:hypothetical protein